MDLYALQMTPRKKDDKEKERENDLKKTKEYLLTKDELLADLKKDKPKGFFERVFSGSSKQKEAEQVSGKEASQEEKKIASPFLDGVQKVVSIPAPPKKKKLAASVSVGQVLHFRNELEKSREALKKQAAEKIKKDEKKETVGLLEKNQQEILDLLSIVARSGDEGKLELAVEKLARLRTENEAECQNDTHLNVAIRRELFKSVSSALAYKGIKEMVRILQLTDTLNLEIVPADFSVLPTEVLESSEMHVAAVRYLIWCAKEYEENPSEFEKKIACFVQAGILTFDEIGRLPEVQDVILSSIFEYIKNHLKNPTEISRKIYQYSLAGFLDGDRLKKSEKVRNLVKSYLRETMEKHQDRPEEIERKIRGYEIAGFIERQDLRDDEKIKRTIEKQLGRYVKINKEHPRKVSARVKEYLTMGLATKDEAESFLKGV